MRRAAYIGCALYGLTVFCMVADGLVYQVAYSDTLERILVRLGVEY